MRPRLHEQTEFTFAIRSIPTVSRPVYLGGLSSTAAARCRTTRRNRALVSLPDTQKLDRVRVILAASPWGKK